MNELNEMKKLVASLMAENEAMKKKGVASKEKRIVEVDEGVIWKRCSFLACWFLVRFKDKNKDFGGGGSNSGRKWDLGDICKVGNRARNKGVKNEREVDKIVMERLVLCGDISKKEEIEAQVKMEVEGVERMRVLGRKEVFRMFMRDGRVEEIEKNRQHWDEEINEVRIEEIEKAIKSDKIEAASLKVEIKNEKDAKKKKDLVDTLADVEKEIKELGEELKKLKGGDKDE